MAFNSTFSGPISELPPPPAYKDSLSKWTGTWTGGFDIESLMKYAKAINKHNCIFCCCVRFCMPRSALESSTTIAPGPDRDVDLTTFIITERSASGIAYTNKVTVGKTQIMDTVFGNCKVTVTESYFDDSVKWRYEVLGINEMVKDFHADIGTIITLTSRLDSYDNNKMISVMEVNGECIEFNSYRKSNIDILSTSVNVRRRPTDIHYRK